MKKLILSILLLPLLSTAQENPSQPPQKPNKVVIVPIQEGIAPPELYILRRGLKTAIEQGADTVILDMKTPGGRLDTTFEILTALDKFPGKTITYINDEAISAGALISAGTDEIWFAPTAIIGAAAPVTGGGADIDVTMKQKIVSYLKARVRAMSKEDENRAKAISAMIDADYELKFGEEIIKPKGELLTLTADEAMKKYGDPAHPLLATGIAPTLTDLTDTLFGKGNYQVIKLEVTWSEKLAQFITTIAPLLLAAGLLLIFIEFKTPGFGIFGISGGIILAIVFFGHYAAGLSGHEPAIIFFIGFALVIIDLFFLPGLFFLAIPGFIMMLGSLLWAMSDIWPNQPIVFDSNLLLTPVTNLSLGILGAILLFFLLLRFMPKGGLWGKMVLETAVAAGPASYSISQNQPNLIGKTGIAVTDLFPSGQIEINGQRYDARLNIGTAPAGSTVKVISSGQFDLTVQQISQLPTPNSQLPTPSSNLPAPTSPLPAPSSMTLIITLISVGLILLLLEVIVPGAILGIAGAILLFIGTILSFVKLGTQYGLIALAFTSIAAFLLFYIQFKILPKTSIGKRYFLKSQITATSSNLKNEFADLIGKTAISTTILSPSGYITIGNNQYEAVSQSGHIPINTELTVTSATPFQLTVKIKN